MFVHMYKLSTIKDYGYIEQSYDKFDNYEYRLNIVNLGTLIWGIVGLQNFLDVDLVFQKKKKKKKKSTWIYVCGSPSPCGAFLLFSAPTVALFPIPLQLCPCGCGLRSPNPNLTNPLI